MNIKTVMMKNITIENWKSAKRARGRIVYYTKQSGDARGIRVEKVPQDENYEGAKLWVYRRYKWPSNTNLVLNGVDLGLPNAISRYGTLRWTLSQEETAGIFNEVEREVVVSVVQKEASAPTPAPRVEQQKSKPAPAKVDPFAANMWTKTPTTYDECNAFMRDVFMADAPFRKKYFDLKGRWNHRTGPPGNRKYPKRAGLTWEEVCEAQRVFEEVKKRSRARMDELSALTKPLWDKAQEEKKEQERRRREEQNRPVDLTNPEVKRQYEERNRRLMNEQRENIRRALEKARAELEQYNNLSPSRQDPTTARNLRRKVERLEWEDSGMDPAKKPSWIE